MLQGEALDSEHLSELTEEEHEISIVNRSHMKGFMRLDLRYFIPFFTRRLTQQASNRRATCE